MMQIRMTISKPDEWGAIVAGLFNTVVERIVIFTYSLADYDVAGGCVEKRVGHVG